MIKQLFVEGLSGECRMKDEPPETTIVRINNGSVQLNLHMLSSMRLQMLIRMAVLLGLMASSNADSFEPTLSVASLSSP